MRWVCGVVWEESQDSVSCKRDDDEGLQNHREIEQGDCSYLMWGWNELLGESF